MKKKSSIIDYCKYWFKSTNEHGVHSPFVFDLVTNVIYTDKDYYSYKPLEYFREKLLRSDKQIDNVRVSELATEALSSKYSQLLFRFVNRFQPQNIIEIGNSIGIETAYMASARSSVKVIKLDVSKTLIPVLKENFKALKVKNVELHETSVPHLSTALKMSEVVDFVFINTQSPKDVSDSFSQCLEKANDNSVFVVNNISASNEMKEVWEQMKSNDSVKITLDLFQLGIVFFRKEQVKEHFLIRF